MIKISVPGICETSMKGAVRFFKRIVNLTVTAKLS